MTRSRKVLLAVVACVLVPGCSGKTDDSDPPGARSGMVPLRDNLTGCEYLMVRGYHYGTAVVPRMGADGKQICRGLEQ